MAVVRLTNLPRFVAVLVAFLLGFVIVGCSPGSHGWSLIIENECDHEVTVAWVSSSDGGVFGDPVSEIVVGAGSSSSIGFLEGSEALIVVPGTGFRREFRFPDGTPSEDEDVVVVLEGDACQVAAD